MSRSLELGRAVLCSPATNLELWLTTLITVLPQQDEANIQQLKPAQLLDLLSSGNVWVRRGSGMHVELHLTLREEPLPQRQLQEVAETLLRAPVWEQLMVQPSLPPNAIFEPGTLRLNMTHANNSAPQEEQRRQRVFSSVPAADVQPPEGIPTIALQSVRLSMDVMDIRPRPRTTHKRSKVAAGENELLRSETGQFEPDDSEESDTLLHEVSHPYTDEPRTSHTSTAATQPIKRKREESKSQRTTSSPMPRSHQRRDFRRRPVSISDLQPSTHTTLISSDQLDIESIVDGALRLSAYGRFNGRSARGLKVKANTFCHGLADVAPALWRPGYLHALSQRAHLLNTVSRSISQVACLKATSLSLKHKSCRLGVVSGEGPAEDFREQGSDVERNAAQTTSSVMCRLWLHLQKNLAGKPMTSLQTFLASDVQAGAPPDSDEMLEEVRPREGLLHNMRTLDFEDSEKSEQFDEEPMLHETLSSSAELERNPLDETVPRSLDPKPGSGEIGDDLLFDAGCPGTCPMVPFCDEEESALMHSVASDPTSTHLFARSDYTISSV